MKRSARIALALLLPLCLLASICPGDSDDRLVEPASTGTIQGTVTIDGNGAQGVTVSLAGAGNATTTTSASGSYSLEGVPMGALTVTISGFPSEAEFPATSKSATLSQDGQVVTIDFDGTIPPGRIIGTVSADDSMMVDVAVHAVGPGSGSATTDEDGSYAIPDLPAGTYEVEIDGYDTDRYEFSETRKTAVLSPGGTRTVDFEGTVKAEPLAISITPTSISATHERLVSDCPQLVGTITLTNTGIRDLEWSVESDHFALVVDPEEGALEPGESIDVTVYFNCETTSSFEATLSFVATTETGEAVETAVPVDVTITSDDGENPGTG